MFIQRSACGQDWEDVRARRQRRGSRILRRAMCSLDYMFFVRVNQVLVRLWARVSGSVLWGLGGQSLD
jgi:hypothetical protein